MGVGLSSGTVGVYRLLFLILELINWVFVKGFNLSYHNKETLLALLLTIDPNYGNSNKIPKQEQSKTTT